LLLLGVPAEVAERDACAMEHLLSKETYVAIEKFKKSKKAKK
jgi:Mn-dependent DtxR family transcriptional regulator